MTWVIIQLQYAISLFVHAYFFGQWYRRYKKQLNIVQLLLYNNYINDELQKSLLPTNWIQINEEPVCWLKLYFRWDCKSMYCSNNLCRFILEVLLPWSRGENDITSNFLSHIKHSNVILGLLTKLTQAQICVGNHDDSFFYMSAERNNRFVNSKGVLQHMLIVKLLNLMDK